MATLMLMATATQQSEIIELAAEEGHDADIPTNLGVLPDLVDVKKKELRRHNNNNNHHDGVTEASRDIDLEKSEVSSAKSSLAEQEEENEDSPAPAERDANIVDWDGPSDPANPLNWPARKKWGTIAIVSAFTFLTPLGSSMFAPGVPELMAEFNSNSSILAGFVVSIYVLGFAFGPLVIAPLSEMVGRLPLYHACNVLFIAFNVGCARSSSLGMLIAFRFLAGCVGASPLTLGGGTIADLMPREQRGTAMGFWVAGPTVGPVVGPIAGGFLSQAAGWRWVFYLISITAGVIAVMGFLLLQETYGLAILNRRVRRLRKETGNTALRSALDAGLSPKTLFATSIVRPTKLLLRSPIVFLLSLYVAVAYSYLYILFTTFTSVFESRYGFGPGIAGLTYLGVGLGSVAGQLTYTILGNRSVRAHLAAGDFKPEHRLPLMFPGAVAMPIGLFWYGWSIHAHAHWIVPILGTSLIGFGLLLIFMAPNTYLVDVYTRHAASAMAANTVLRSVVAAFVPLAGQDMYAALGLGWGNSLLGFVALALVPIPIFFVKYGERIRRSEKLRL
ncbi:uncharacterized protein K452DRAFT_328851 [Aplosporella prunicola CBS 121167]|uniref:Major facilitator superfamily (MFS) profile domain-containing protein n=1 Tax=Aplosporella prunicola CBS 121167 TaxID=1176127 RepID=A0A6A6B692_9PEZI|nr:uncharacterized protein K452DRAFT_328851 [Aplosporella prunicola CBS 121167]KAF2138301.1 hypothetical protein K452DRAFT_328851 [Aplosporella prunicola CBS 121167]